jgi:hypothetical protein
MLLNDDFFREIGGIYSGEREGMLRRGKLRVED